MGKPGAGGNFAACVGVEGEVAELIQYDDGLCLGEELKIIDSQIASVCG